MALDSFHSTLSALEFDTFCNDYGIRSEFGPELTGLNDTICDFPEGKIGVYTWFFEFANFRTLLNDILTASEIIRKSFLFADRVKSSMYAHAAPVSVFYDEMEEGRPPKSVTGESAVGSFYEATDDLCSSEASSKLLVSKESSNT
ncbi:hypothetical protein Tco_0715635 [Tanacetum coccineum]